MQGGSPDFVLSPEEFVKNGNGLESSVGDIAREASKVLHHCLKIKLRKCAVPTLDLRRGRCRATL